MIYRWTARRKAELLQHITDGRLSDAAACALYELSAEELAAWRRDFTAHGKLGLRAMQVQHYQVMRRENPPDPPTSAGAANGGLRKPPRRVARAANPGPPSAPADRP